MTTPNEGSRNRSKRALLVGVPLLLAGGAYLGLVVWQGDKIADGTRVAGVDVGGMTKEQAQAQVEKRAKALEAKPVTITLGSEGQARIIPATSGLALDVEESMGDVGSQSMNPLTLVGRMSGGEEKPAVVKADSKKVADAVGAASGKVLTSSTKEGSVSIEGGELAVVRSVSGQGINPDEVAGEVIEGWPGKTDVRAKVAQREPRLSNAEIDRFVKSFAKPAVSQSITLTAGGESAELSPEDIGDLVTIKNSGGKLSATINGAEAADELRETESELETLPRDAKITMAGGKVAPVAGKDGEVIDEKKLGPFLVKSLSGTDRSVVAPMKVQKPAVTTADLKGLDTKTVITEYRSKFPGGASNKIRTQNMGVALAAINGTVVPKGGQFSLINTLGGDLTPEKGYGAAPTIQGGKERAAQGGGVSQVSTAMYNAAFFAGVRLDEHKAHSFWIERYPAGREATIWVPHIDNKWTNDTDAPIVVTGKIEGNEVVISFLGKRKYEVETTSSEKYNIRQPKTIKDDHPGCLPVPTNIGFDIDVTRTLKQGGAVARTEKETTSYQAANRVECTNT